jgi:hypothetical protein
MTFFLPCHSERSEESGFLPVARKTRIARFARDDTGEGKVGGRDMSKRARSRIRGPWNLSGVWWLSGGPAGRKESGFLALLGMTNIFE